MNEWYQKLKKAPWTPPNYVFGVVWTILYLLMAISAYLIFINKCAIHFAIINNIFYSIID